MQSGATFTTDLTRLTGMEPSRVRLALDELLRRGQVTNDRFDPLRPGGQAAGEIAPWRHPWAIESPRIEGQRSVPSSAFRTAKARDLGRTRLQPSGEIATHLAEASSSSPGFDPDSTPQSCEGLATFDLGAEVAVEALFSRYGVLTRETVALDAWAPDWRDLAAFLDRAELRGEVRRGYFVEGLSGVQYGAPEAVESLARAGADRGVVPPMVLISTVDPANLYGAGAPLDINLLEGGTARLTRSGANYLVIREGRPVLIIEAEGKRLTGLASASPDELRSAVGLLPSLARGSRRVLKVETFNTAPSLASPAAPWLVEAGFVRDHPGMTFYAAW